MCGRYALAVKPEDVEEEFSMIRIEWFPPRYNIAPTQPILVIRADRGERQAALVRWGLIPSWAREPAELPLFFNARAETAATKPAFRGPFRHRRCLIPASGFYEWRKDPGGKKQPFYLRPARSKLVAFAGLWEEWADANGNMLDSATILTTDSNADVAAIHERMPVIIGHGDFDRWLGVGEHGGEALADLLTPAPAGTFQAFAVDPRVNNARNDDPSLQAPLAPADPPPRPLTVSKPKAAPADSGEPPDQLKLL
ncbi:SOS response-associated peptidase [Kaistia dalseonensis]|uniref:Abasic site processing protein n=1 Tax=Kaistia dalseonensis TaxID=410840 RepID=A0ABU0HDX1_9HYPH|nr:SOS response-associated peptidase [Kaistia dalseonensis]MCX5497518.1 SOS response-associated peptidase [Kaistia dalseonensis]MDQ0440157.1 putative SOS response-associated peptidase YedK [Kaistia dalseonensis]